MNGPNILTLFRILLIPVLVVFLLSDSGLSRIPAFAVFLLAAVTDLLDGVWARKKGKITVMGQLLDPTADKLLIASVLICLVTRDLVPAWMAIIIIGRELAVTGFRALAASRGVTLAASVWGKVKMNVMIYTIALLILGPGILGGFFFLAEIGLWLSVIAAITSAAEYYIRYGKKVLSSNNP
ncbi:MAG: CDP-diacylglycerol--glycerol-3-phosphate 3-phosphatidyltransferase [Acidobacteria bacterium]|nr:CDP-diacylglycerol--glycerol-3-phosphate 3-phosphatidyltransferase [Acidobacteriota bacterium]